MKIKQKTIYGGYLTDKYFLILENDIQVQVPLCDWERYKVGDVYDEYTFKQKSALDELVKIAQKHNLY